MSKAQCFDCDGEVFGFPSRGDGKCRYCDGDGFTYEFDDKVKEFFTQKKSTTKCLYCSGSGKCQTCRGTGLVNK